MPCTPSGKLDKNRLPDVVIEAGKRDAAVIRPVTELEKRITAIWEDVLGVTDLGMTGPVESVIGIKPEQSIGKFLGDVPRRYECAHGKAKLEGALFTIDDATGRCLEARTVRCI